MIKTLELSTPNSCWNKAQESEMVFVLLARDPAAPATINAWIRERIRRGKNHINDAQIVEARQCGSYMRQGRTEILQDDFDITIGRLDHTLSLLVQWGCTKWSL